MSEKRTNAKENHKGDAAAKPDCVWFDDDKAEIPFVHGCEERWVCNSGHVDCESEKVNDHKYNEKLSQAKTKEQEVNGWRAKCFC